MKLIEPKFDIIEQEDDILGIYKQIELCGRTCYKSENLIKEGSAETFTNRMKNSKHYAMLEHGAVYLKCPKRNEEDFIKYKYNHYSRYNQDDEYIYVSTNLRVLVENDWEDDLKYLCDYTPMHTRRVTVRFTTDRGVSAEANRHRVNSPAESSTRYCNYSNDKFGNEISVIRNEDIDINELSNVGDKWSGDSDDTIFRNMCSFISCNRDENFNVIDAWYFGNLACEWSYMRLINLGWKPQQARRILPLDLQIELCHSAFVDDWKHFFDLRAIGTTGAPHSDMKQLAQPLLDEFIKRNYI